MNCPAPRVDAMEKFWQATYKSLGLDGWKTSSGYLNGWRVIFRAIKDEIGFRIVEWNGFRDMITWFEGDELVIALKPNKETLAEAEMLVKEYLG